MTYLLLLKESIAVGLIALLLFVPITGLVLEGYSFTAHWDRPVLFAGMVMLGRLLLGLALLTHRGRALYERLFRHSAHPTGMVKMRTARTTLWMVVLFLAVSSILPFFLSKYWISVAILAWIYVLLGLGLNIVVGMAGLLDLGYVAFSAVGAYGCALSGHYLGLSFWIALPLSALLAALFGAFLAFPVLRMHGDYLAIVTLGFGEIIRLVLNNWIAFTGGPNGIAASFPTLFGLEFSRSAVAGHTTFHEFFGIAYSNIHRSLFLYFVLLLCVTLTILFAARLRTMPLGRFWDALREDEIACRSMGINHVTVKLAAFTLGACIGGMGGAFFAASQGFINPTSFTFFESALILAVVVLGGMGSIVGVVLAALVLTILPELLRSFADYRILLFGVAMVLMMIWRPRGLLKSTRQGFVIPRGQA